MSAIIGIALVAFFMGVLIQPKSNEYFNRLAQAKTYDAQLRLMPRDAVVDCRRANRGRAVLARHWPRESGIGLASAPAGPQGQLESKIDEHLKSGRRVFLDTDPRWWLPCSWHVSEIEELAKIEPHFHFKEVAPRIYEIRPLEDQSAKDQPHLENLLPEKRPEEVKRCFDSG